MPVEFDAKNLAVFARLTGGVRAACGGAHGLQGISNII